MHFTLIGGRIDMPVSTDLVNSDNKDLIKWAGKHIEDPAEFDRLMNIIFFELRIFFGTDKDKIKKRLFDKMRRASQEYPTPYMDHWKVKSEQEAEMIDLIGWKLVELFNVKFGAEKKRHGTIKI
jgi:hypothetical protein